ncbi:hypothetical protein HOG47_08560 [archaeon]|jgi:hypothetical protein|nr:hypothetical protein [archaeon]
MLKEIWDYGINPIGTTAYNITKNINDGTNKLANELLKPLDTGKMEWGSEENDFLKKGEKIIDDFNDNLKFGVKSIGKKGIDITKGIFNKEKRGEEGEKVNDYFDLDVSGNTDNLEIFYMRSEKYDKERKDKHGNITPEEELKIENARTDIEKEVVQLQLEYEKLKEITIEKRRIIEASLNVLPDNDKQKPQNIFNEIEDDRLRGNLLKLENEIKEIILLKWEHKKKTIRNEWEKLQKDNPSIIKNMFNKSYYIKKKELKNKLEFYRKYKNMIQNTILNITEYEILLYLEDFKQNVNNSEKVYQNLFVFLNLAKPNIMSKSWQKIEVNIETLKYIEEYQN